MGKQKECICVAQIYLGAKRCAGALGVAPYAVSRLWFSGGAVRPAGPHPGFCLRLVLCRLFSWETGPFFGLAP